jgi:hypothetical protein
MRQADLSLRIDRRKPACVLDPALVLCHAQGPLLAQRLAAVFEPWLTRSFWQAIDESELLLPRMARGDVPAGPSTGAASMPSAAALQTWIALREATPAGEWNQRWIGDRLPESQLPEAADAALVERYEALLCALPPAASSGEMPQAATRVWGRFDAAAAALDALALSAALDGALLLCAQASASTDGLPWPLQAAGRVGLAVERVSPERQALWTAERDFVRQAVAGAGLAPMALACLPALWVVHAVVLDDEPHATDGAPEPWRDARISGYAL